MKECHHVTKSNSNADGKKVGWFPCCFYFCVSYVVFSFNWKIKNLQLEGTGSIPDSTETLPCVLFPLMLWHLANLYVFRLQNWDNIMYFANAILFCFMLTYIIFIKTLINTFDKSLLKLLFVTVKIKWTSDNPYIQMHFQSTGETVYWGQL